MLTEMYGGMSNVSSISGDLTDKFGALFPTWTTVFATVTALIIILIVLGPLIFKSTKKMVEKRRKYIQDNIDQAEKYNNDAQIDRREANQELMHARKSASEIISKAKLDAEQYKQSNLSIAKDEAAKIISNARSDMRQEKAKIEADYKEAIIDVALAAASKVVEGAIDKKASKKIIDEFIKV